MALYTPGPLVARISGNVGSVNFALTRSGPVIRKRSAHLKRQSDRLLQQRANFQTAHAQWLALSNLQRGAWTSAARNHTWKNRLGLPRQISGWQLFLKITLTKGNHILTDLTIPPIMTVSESPIYPVLTPSLPDNVFCSWGPNYPAPTETVVFFGARVVRNRAQAIYQNWKFLRYEDGPGTASDLGPTFIAAFGDLLLDDVIAVKLFAWQAPNLPSMPQSTTAAVTA